MGAVAAHSPVILSNALDLTTQSGDPPPSPVPLDQVGASGYPGGFSDSATVGAAVPEPASWALLAFGFAGLGLAGISREEKASPALIVAEKRT
jgi:hypothetical protein